MEKLFNDNKELSKISEKLKKEAERVTVVAVLKQIGEGIAQYYQSLMGKDKTEQEKAIEVVKEREFYQTLN